MQSCRPCPKVGVAPAMTVNAGSARTALPDEKAQMRNMNAGDGKPGSQPQWSSSILCRSPGCTNTAKILENSAQSDLLSRFKYYPDQGKMPSCRYQAVPVTHISPELFFWPGTLLIESFFIPQFIPCGE